MGTSISWVGTSARFARGWNREAWVPVARVRLNAMLARTSEAASAVNVPDGRLRLLGVQVSKPARWLNDADATAVRRVRSATR